MGKEVALNPTTSGLYCIHIDKSEEVPVENVSAVNLDILSKQDRIKALLKCIDSLLTHQRIGCLLS